MNKAKHLFELIDRLDEGDYAKFSIVNVTDDYGDWDKSYGVYHSEGYRFNVEKQVVEDIPLFIEEFGECAGFDKESGCYFYFADNLFEGFDECSIDKAIELIRL